MTKKILISKYKYLMQKIFRFRGGIKTDGNKEVSLTKDIQPLFIPDFIYLNYKNLNKLINLNDEVFAGQLIASDKKGKNLFASTSGYIHEINNDKIIIRTDKKHFFQVKTLENNYKNLSKEYILEKIKYFQIIGLGGAGFSTYRKIKTSLKHKIQLLIINGCECEPFITTDDILMQKKAEQIIEGVKILQLVLEAENVVIAIEDNKPLAIQKMQEFGINIAVLPTIYPQGSSKQLAFSLTGKDIPKGKHSADIGIYSQNVATCLAIYEAVCLNLPLISRIVTLSGNQVKNSANYQILFGTKISDFFHFTENYTSSFIIGGSIMGEMNNNLNHILSIENSILINKEEEKEIFPCIRCAKCADVCPINLLPQQMFLFAQNDNFEKLKRENLFDCIECGCCDFVCPSNIPLTEYFKAEKKLIRIQEAKDLKSKVAKEKFELRQKRIKKIEKEKEIKRAERIQKMQEVKIANPVQSELNSLKIKLSMTQVALKKTQKQLELIPDDQNLIASINKLETHIQDLNKKIQSLS